MALGGDSRSNKRRTVRRTLAVVALLVGVLSIGAASAQADYLGHIRDVLRKRSPGTEGEVWWLRHGNVLPGPSAGVPQGWLLQTPNCWGQTECTQPPPGGRAFLTKLEQMVAFAKKSVDIADLGKLSFLHDGYPDGAFFKAIEAGLKRGHKEHPDQVPLVRFLIGVHPPTVPSPAPSINTLKREVGDWVRVEVGYMRTRLFSWNHAKVVDADSKEAIVGGMNYWAGDYLATRHPVNDVSMWVQGPVAGDVSKFMNTMWRWTCEHRFIPFNGVGVQMFNTGGFFNSQCVDDISTNGPPPDEKRGVNIMVVGKLGHGIPVPGQNHDKESTPFTRPKLSGNTCNPQQAKDDNKDVNNKRDYEYRNPGETALRTLISDAKSSIFISQQDLLSCLPKPAVATEAKFDERVFAALARKVVEGVPIKIVLSADRGGDYSNGWQAANVGQVLLEMVQRNEGLSEGDARRRICQDVGLANIRNSANADKWGDGTKFYNHAKVVAVDDRAFYIGSGNLYPSGLQELGFIVEDPTAAAQLKSWYLDPMWTNSRPGARIDPQTGHCDF
jgi:phosphatidylserine/phosphatidylglycerophosphate/cardiolipin synthase-like enzyme